MFLAFLSPKIDPSNDAIDNEMEDGSVGTLPTRQDEEFRPFIRRLPEFQFWYWATRAIFFSFVAAWIPFFDIPVFWPVLVTYWMVLFFLTSMLPPGMLVALGNRMLTRHVVRQQIQHMIKYRYVPFSFGKKKYSKNSS